MFKLIVVVVGVPVAWLRCCIDTSRTLGVLSQLGDNEVGRADVS